MRDRPGIVSRRNFLWQVGSLAALGCARAPNTDSLSASDDGRFLQRPHPPTQSLSPGVHQMPNGVERGGHVYVPQPYRHDTPSAAALMLHGAGRTSAEWVGEPRITSMMDELGIILLAPTAPRVTWHVDGQDSVTIDNAMRFAFDHLNIDVRRFALGGFSDGASCAISLGLRNGDVIQNLLILAPGYLVPGPRRGKARVFLGHGKADTILPFTTSERIAKELADDGYDVRFVPHLDGHGINAFNFRTGMEWLSNRPAG